MERERDTRLGCRTVSRLVCLLGLVIVLLVASTSTSPASLSSPTGSEQSQIDTRITSLLSGIPEHGNILGKWKAPVTLVWFGDLQCPICAEFAQGAFPDLVKRWVRAGKLRMEYRSLQTATLSPTEFRRQQSAALAAGRQDLMWYFVELFYYEEGEQGSGYATEAYLDGLASQVPGLDLAAWLSDRRNPGYVKQIQRDERAAAKEGFQGTPSFLIGRTGTRLKTLDVESLTDPRFFDGAIKALLRS